MVDLGADGKSPAQIAAELGVAQQTLENWGTNHKEFLEALMISRTKCKAWWENVGQNALFADKFQQNVWTKSMQARFREDYTERLAHTDAQGGPAKVVLMVMTAGAPEVEDGAVEADPKWPTSG